MDYLVEQMSSKKTGTITSAVFLKPKMAGIETGLVGVC